MLWTATDTADVVRVTDVTADSNLPTWRAWLTQLTQTVKQTQTQRQLQYTETFGNAGKWEGHARCRCHDLKLHELKAMLCDDRTGLSSVVKENWSYCRQRTLFLYFLLTNDNVTLQVQELGRKWPRTANNRQTYRDTMSGHSRQRALYLSLSSIFIRAISIDCYC